MIAAEDLYIMDVAEFTKELYRMGNATWPAFTEERARVDVVIIRRNGIEIVIANGNGFSAFDYLTPIMKKPGKKVWKIRKGASLPTGLKLVKDRRAGHQSHYMIAPAYDMPLEKYLGLMKDFGLNRSKVEILNIGARANVG